MTNLRISLILILVQAACLAAMFPAPASGAGFPLSITDATQRQVLFSASPQRVVCLAPYITDMLSEFGQERILVGLTREDLLSHSALRKSNIGSYFTPDIDAIRDCRPDLVIASPSHEAVIRHFEKSTCSLLVMEAVTLEEGFAHMEMIGRLFGCEAAAHEVVQRNRDQLALVAARLAGIPEREKKRVARVMISDGLYSPGDDSFQHETITAAGGIAPSWGRTGFAVPVDLEAWQRFNPQFVYGCHLNQEEVKAFLKRDGWKDVDAVRNRSVSMFPCELTCRVSVRVGAFVQWLAAVLYPDVFADPATAVLGNDVLERKPLELDMDYVARAGVVTHRVADAAYKSVMVRFKRPMDVISTLEGPRPAVQGVGNTYVPMHASLGHMARGISDVQKAIAGNLGFETQAYTGLMTGANMDNLSIQQRTYKDLKVTVLVTAGVRGNALRVAEEFKKHDKPGTINIIVLANRRLSPGAMTWALVVVTEAKSAALLDLDVRSTYTPWEHAATGTGTDTIIVVQGEGPDAPYAGGHTRIGQMIAGAVHAGVTEAVSRQNGLKADRDLLQRLNERQLRLDRMANLYGLKTDPRVLASRIEAVLADPYYAAFIETALAVSDAHRTGLIKDLTFFDATCASVTARLSGRSDIAPMDISSVPLPEAMAKALGALVAGIVDSETGEERP
ncbi:adenosylcobinamide amidohydrolase [uncultured Desulfosarcina sp.]|uniref:adenosylcobinamide amidohydrolase n=1 Tax=uncultured Desulfosarcina sp. TaxID=218289 RepID=UPI0029C76D97|nr:adenosylcobinamide amidohydrolase [uncultured Desulfosarcina sp.]